jgi:hypothetical protein
MKLFKDSLITALLLLAFEAAVWRRQWNEFELS